MNKMNIGMDKFDEKVAAMIDGNKKPLWHDQNGLG